MAKVTRRFDILSPPVLYGGIYLLLFGLGAIDIVFLRDSDAYRVGRVFIDFHGISASALAYVWFGYVLFALGYYLPVGRVVARAFSQGRFIFKPRRTFLVTAALFTTAYLISIWYAQKYGYVRRSITLESDPVSYLLIVGDLTLMAFSMGMWYFFLSRHPGGPIISKKAALFFWGIMLPLQTLLYIWGGSRTRLAFLALIIMLAYHYGYRRIKPRFFLVGAFVIFWVLMPAIAVLRTSADERPTIESVSSGLQLIWDSVMTRTSGMEGFTVAWENLNKAPETDPLWMTVATVIPRIVWSGKPFSTWTLRFSEWASNIPSAQLSPTLPGEFLLRFGYSGGLLAMFGLGVLWRILLVALVGYRAKPFASGFIYIVLMTLSLQTIESGFVIEYGALLRFLVVGLIVFWVVSRRQPRSIQV